MNRQRSAASDGYRDRFSSWILSEGARSRSIPTLIDALCRFLNAEGFAIRRCNLATDTIHPQMTGMRHVWFAEAIDAGPINPAVLVSRRQFHMGEALIDEIFFNAGSQDSPQYRASPFHVVEQRGELYDIVRAAGEPQPYPLFDDLLRQGCTAYYGLRLESFAGMLQKIGMATRRVGGLDEARQDDLRWSLQHMTLHLNTLIEHSIRETLARVYLGRDPGQRVSEGMISVGNVVALEGAIWFSDLRGFTTASEELSPETLIETLNRYFETLVGPIHAHGGEILKFIGDAVLAVFPTARAGDAMRACRAALRAFDEAERALQLVNAERSAAGERPLAHGVGLHYGNAHYGNIGTSDRLDFTLIGREVNVASRIEGLTKQLDRTLLCTKVFAQAAQIPMSDLGFFELAGVSGKVEIMGIKGASV